VVRDAGRARHDYWHVGAFTALCHEGDGCYTRSNLTGDRSDRQLPMGSGEEASISTPYRSGTAPAKVHPDENAPQQENPGDCVGVHACSLRLCDGPRREGPSQ
jgi:hypothetical protein